MDADRLLALRQRLGWTQVELAEALGCHPNTVACMERGEKPVTRATGMTAHWLALALTGKPP